MSFPPISLWGQLGWTQRWLEDQDRVPSTDKKSFKKSRCFPTQGVEQGNSHVQTVWGKVLPFILYCLSSPLWPQDTLQWCGGNGRWVSNEVPSERKRLSGHRSCGPKDTG